MGKVKRIIRKKLDLNKDGKVNFKDFSAKLKGMIDSDDNGYVDVNELLNAVEKSIEIVDSLKAGV